MPATRRNSRPHPPNWLCATTCRSPRCTARPPPRWGHGRGPPPAAVHQPTDDGAGEKRPGRRRDAGDVESFVVAAAPYGAEHQHAAARLHTPATPAAACSETTGWPVGCSSRRTRWQAGCYEHSKHLPRSTETTRWASTHRCPATRSRCATPSESSAPSTSSRTSRSGSRSATSRSANSASSSANSACSACTWTATDAAAPRRCTTAWPVWSWRPPTPAFGRWSRCRDRWRCSRSGTSAPRNRSSSGFPAWPPANCSAASGSPNPTPDPIPRR